MKYYLVLLLSVILLHNAIQTNATSNLTICDEIQGLNILQMNNDTEIELLVLESDLNGNAITGDSVFYLMQSCDDFSFVEKEGILIVEVESISPGPGWVVDTSQVGYTGVSYYRWGGGDKFNMPGSGMMEYNITITNPGTYRFLWHSKITHGNIKTESNDSWLRIPGADDFFAKRGTSIKYPKGGMFVQSGLIVEGASAGGWMKVYSSGTLNWTWSSNTSDSDAHLIYAKFNHPGTYTVQISGRSNNHGIDRFVLFNEALYSKEEATNLSRKETACDGIVPNYYSALVLNGDGSGVFQEGQTVHISADPAQIGFAFDAWTGAVQFLYDINSPNQSFLMPAENVTFVANYTELLYTLTVANGSGTGHYNYGDVVFVSADDPMDGTVFQVWQGDVDIVLDSMMQSTSVTIPDRDTEIVATYKDITGVNTLHFGAITMYPVPFYNTFFLNGSSELQSIKIISSTGQILFAEDISSTPFQVALPCSLSGIYMVNIQLNDGRILSERIIKW